MKNLKLILAAALVLAGLNANAQVLRGLTRQTVFTNLVCPTTINAGTQSNLTSQVVFIQPGYGMGIQISATGLGTTNTENVGVKAYLSKDGTNFSTIPRLYFLMPLNGTTAQIDCTNIPASVLDGFAAIRVGQFTNASVNAVSGVTVGVSRVRQTAP